MNVVIDLGNTRVKAALFEGDVLIKKIAFDSVSDLHKFLESNPFENGIISSVSDSAQESLDRLTVSNKKFYLSTQLPLPIQIKYQTSKTLGVDRIAAVCGALSFFPKKDCLIIDAGTCINYEFLDADGNYLGGAISPGIEMRFKAMHTFTARLPLIKPKADAELTGTTTESCMQSGVMNGASHEINGIIEQYLNKYPSLSILLCGGDAPFFENKLKPTIFVAPDLVFVGLNRILSHNVSR